MPNTGSSDAEQLSAGPAADSFARWETVSRVQLRCIAKRRAAPLTRSPNTQSSGSGAVARTEPGWFQSPHVRKPEVRDDLARTCQPVSEGASDQKRHDHRRH